MSDMAMKQFLAGKPIGASVWVKAKDLQLTTDQFHAAVKTWMTQSGGPGFWYLESHAESGSGLKRFDMVKVQRTA